MHSTYTSNLPAAIVNVVILVMRPVRTDAAASVGIRA
jgi:hypothetical protein